MTDKKPTQLKQSDMRFRNINGIEYRAWTSDPDSFDFVKKQCKKQGTKYRTIDGELFIEIKSDKLNLSQTTPI